MKTVANRNQNKASKESSVGKVLLAPELQLALFGIAHILIFFLLFHTIYKIEYSATGIYFDFASKVLDGNLPYRDFTLEYPPFALLFFILPRLIADNWQTFSTVYQAEVLIFDLIALVFLYLIARRLGKAPWKLLGIYTLAVLAIGPIIAQQYDIFPAVLTLASLYFFWIGKHKTSWVFLALGALTKVYPLVLAPIYIIYYIRNKQYKNLWSGLITLGVIGLVTVLPFLILSSDAIWSLVSYHSQRGIQLESTYSSFLLIAEKLGWTYSSVQFDYGSWNLVSPLADTLAKLSTYILGICLIAAFWFIYRQIKPGKSQFTRLGAYSLLVIAIVIITSKVFSPQYLIWLIPILPLIFNRWRFAIWLIFICIGALTFYIFPLNYIPLMQKDTGLVIILFMRDILIILTAALLIVSLRQMKASD